MSLCHKYAAPLKENSSYTFDSDFSFSFFIYTKWNFSMSFDTRSTFLTYLFLHFRCDKIPLVRNIEKVGIPDFSLVVSAVGATRRPAL